jgi:hypothetical protein
MGVKLVSSSGGSVEINPPTTASNFIATMPAGTGDVVVNGINGALVSGTAVASTSGTSIDFTGIPSWVKRITVMFSGVSTNGTSTPQIQIGAGSVTTTGYGSCGSVFSGTAVAATTNSTTGFILGAGGGASDVRHGSAIISSVGSNIWTISGAFGYSSSAVSCCFGGSLALGGTLDRVRITTVGGTDTFDAGSINILYE